MVTGKALLLVPTAGLFLAWFVLFRPAFLAGPASYIMVSGTSMERTLHSGDLALTQKQQSYGMGDVVAFRVPNGEPGEGAMVIHRIVGGTAEDGFITQGDNKENSDVWRPTQGDIVGEMWFRVPGAGRLLATLQSPMVLAGLAGGLGVFLVLSADTGEKRPRKACASKPSDAGRRRWRLPHLTLWLFVAALALIIRR